jgi:hypothetical protein
MKQKKPRESKNVSSNPSAEAGNLMETCSLDFSLHLLYLLMEREAT